VTRRRPPSPKAPASLDVARKSEVGFRWLRVSGLSLVIAAAVGGVEAADFDHRYEAYAELLRLHVRGAFVYYAGLKADRTRLDHVVSTFADATASDEPSWSREQRMAFWINAYNVLTLRAIVDHYPIRVRLVTLSPRNSIRQIPDVWTVLRFQVAGRRVTLDDIEHRILRPVFNDPRIHFAINCASVSCPPLAAEPYRPETLDAQLDDAARRYLASREGLQLMGDTFQVSSIFKWYGDDFVEQYGSVVPSMRNARERAILGVLARYAPDSAAARARAGRGRIRYLDYDWTLNDAAR